MKKQVVVNGRKFFFRQEGRGEPLLLLHGWGKSGAVFSFLQKQLASDYLTIAPDLPGFGRTPLPPGDWGVMEYADLINQFTKKMGWATFSLLGHSFGGRIAIEISARQPRRVNRLILTGTPVLRGKSLKRLFFWFIAKTARLACFFPPFCFLKNILRKGLYFMVGERDYFRAPPKMRAILNKVISYKQTELLSQIKAPTLLVWGENDKMTPLNHARYLQKNIRKSELRVVPNASHKLPSEKPKEFFQEIKLFLGLKSG